MPSSRTNTLDRGLLAYIREAGVGRHDCPLCHSRNTLSITRSNRFLLYNCFDANCSLSGCLRPPEVQPLTQRYLPPQFQARDTTTIDALVTRLHNENRIQYQVPPSNRYASIINPTLGSFVASFYDPAEDRLCAMTDTNIHGRALSRGIIPKAKWYIPNASTDFSTYCIGSLTGLCVIVEDMISALRLSRVSPGTLVVCLHGTELNNSDFVRRISWSRPSISTVIVLLDNDAFLKGKKLVDNLVLLGYNSSLFKIGRDIKDMDEEELARCVNKINTIVNAAE